MADSFIGNVKHAVLGKKDNGPYYDFHGNTQHTKYDIYWGSQLGDSVRSCVQAILLFCLIIQVFRYYSRGTSTVDEIFVPENYLSKYRGFMNWVGSYEAMRNFHAFCILWVLFSIPWIGVAPALFYILFHIFMISTF